MSPAASGPRICLIAAVAANGVIGSEGTLPWRLPEDLKYFKRLTEGHTVIMGRKTWESIGRALPGRRNVVVTRRPGYVAPEASIAASLEAALEACAGEVAVYVIGGAELYRAALPLADQLLLTEIQRDFAGDTRFPEFDRTRWREEAREHRVAPDGLRFDFVNYVRA